MCREYEVHSCKVNNTNYSLFPIILHPKDAGTSLGGPHDSLGQELTNCHLGQISQKQTNKQKKIRTFSAINEINAFLHPKRALEHP